MRSAVLIVFIAAHSILAKWLFAHPPAGVEAADGRVGAQLMYYGGDVIDITLIVLLFAGWYAAPRPRDRFGAGQLTLAGSVVERIMRVHGRRRG